MSVDKVWSPYVSPFSAAQTQPFTDEPDSPGSPAAGDSIEQKHAAPANAYINPFHAEELEPFGSGQGNPVAIGTSVSTDSLDDHAAEALEAASVRRHDPLQAELAPDTTAASPATVAKDKNALKPFIDLFTKTRSPAEAKVLFPTMLFDARAVKSWKVQHKGDEVRAAQEELLGIKLEKPIELSAEDAEQAVAHHRTEGRIFVGLKI